jgi:hypothetical protein
MTIDQSEKYIIWRFCFKTELSFFKLMSNQCEICTQSVKHKLTNFTATHSSVKLVIESLLADAQPSFFSLFSYSERMLLIHII